MGNSLRMRDGRRLEVWEYGDPSGHPIVFFHGLIGSHHQASYLAEPALRLGLRVIAPNRPGVGESDFIARHTAFGAVEDVEDLLKALGLNEFSVIGISGGAPYAVACLQTLGRRVRAATLISGMGPLRWPGALRGMRPSDRVSLELGSRYPHLAQRVFRRWQETFRANPRRFLKGFIEKLVPADRRLFQDEALPSLFLHDLRQVFVDGCGPQSLAHELVVFRRFRIDAAALPSDRRVTLWHGLDDDLVPPSMTWALAQRLPNREAHFVPGGHFVALEIAERVIRRHRQLLTDAEVPS
ncbi:MAG: alpha/beta hydrolase [Isosphaeraceae bacterium]|nr:alpha/beta hydrolase [Isosphaeraceae bacterium]